MYSVYQFISKHTLPGLITKQVLENICNKSNKHEHYGFAK